MAIIVDTEIPPCELNIFTKVSSQTFCWIDNSTKTKGLTTFYFPGFLHVLQLQGQFHGIKNSGSDFCLQNNCGPGSMEFCHGVSPLSVLNVFLP